MLFTQVWSKSLQFLEKSKVWRIYDISELAGFSREKWWKKMVEVIAEVGGTVSYVII